MRAVLAAAYVRKFLEKPLLDAGFEQLDFLEVGFAARALHSFLFTMPPAAVCAASSSYLSASAAERTSCTGTPEAPSALSCLDDSCECTRCWFLQAVLNEHTAPLAEGSPVVCLFVNDDANAQVKETQAWHPRHEVPW